MKTIEGNKLIAEFMGAKLYVPDGSYEMYGIIECIEDGPDEQHFFSPVYMAFHSSWDWLMPVVEKIESLDGEGFDVRIEGNYCIIQDGEHDKIYADQMAHVSDGISNPKIEATWVAVIEFIQWYNDQK